MCVWGKLASNQHENDNIHPGGRRERKKRVIDKLMRTTDGGLWRAHLLSRSETHTHRYANEHGVFMLQIANAFKPIIHCNSAALDSVCLQNSLNSWWYRFSKVLETLLRYFVECSFMMQLSHSSTSPIFSIGLTSGDCWGHFSLVNSLWCSRNP